MTLDPAVGYCCSPHLSILIGKSIRKRASCSAEHEILRWLYFVVSALCAFMVAWILLVVAPSSWLMGRSELHDRLVLKSFANETNRQLLPKEIVIWLWLNCQNVSAISMHARVDLVRKWGPRRSSYPRRQVRCSVKTFSQSGLRRLNLGMVVLMRQKREAFEFKMPYGMACNRYSR